MLQRKDRISKSWHCVNTKSEAGCNKIPLGQRISRRLREEQASELQSTIAAERTSVSLWIVITGPVPSLGKA